MMKKRRLYRFVPLFVSLLFAACSQYYYLPNSAHIPVTLEKGQLRAGGQVALMPLVFRGLEVHGEYNPLQYTNVHVRYLKTRHPVSSFLVPEEAERPEKVSFEMVEMDISGMTPLNQHWHLALTTGGGMGVAQSTYNRERDVYSRLRLRRTFIQPGIVFQDNGMEFGFSARFVQLMYVGGDIHREVPTTALKFIEQLEKKRLYAWPELGLHLGGANESVAFNVDLSYFPYSNSSKGKLANVSFSTGISLCLPGLIR